MYPSQTSLIPVTVALARFVEEHGLSAFSSWYSHWYLGAPFKYLTGPILPSLLALVHQILPNVSLFSITIYFVVLSFLVGAVGWTWLVCKIQKSKFKLLSFDIGHLTFIILLILPWRLFSSLALGEASFTIARNLLPFVLLTYWGIWGDKGDRGNWGRRLVAIAATSLLLLINTSVLPILIVGVVSLVLARSFRKGKIKGITKHLKSALFIILYSLFFVTIWYTPGYLITVLTNPSIGGASGFKVIMRVFDLLKASLPLVLAISSVYFSGKIKSKLSVFALTWTLTFLFLTIFRFIGDPDFWQDWSSWLYEVEIGIALLLSSLLLGSVRRVLKAKNFKSSTNVQMPNNKKQLRFFVILLILISPFYLTWRVHLSLGKPKLISAEIPKGVRSLEKLAEIVESNSTSQRETRVFLSGSTVFWAGSAGASTELSRMSSPLNQVRGGLDKVATHPFWDYAAYQLREGSSPELAKGWLEALGVSYVLVHDSRSPEYYRDFKYVDKWEKVGEKVWEEDGDTIYRIDNIGLAWEVDKNRINRVTPPASGTDLEALQMYLDARKNSFEIRGEEGGYNIVLNETVELVQVLVTFNNKWKAYDEAGDPLKIYKDPLGHILINSAGSKEIILKYN